MFDADAPSFEDRNQYDVFVEEIFFSGTDDGEDLMDLHNVSVDSLADENEGFYQLKRLVKHFKKTKPQSRRTSQLIYELNSIVFDEQ